MLITHAPSSADYFNAEVEVLVWTDIPGVCVGVCGWGVGGARKILYLMLVATLSPPELFCINGQQCKPFCCFNNRGGLNHQCSQTSGEKGAPKHLNQGPSAYQPSTLPLGQCWGDGVAQLVERQTQDSMT